MPGRFHVVFVLERHPEFRNVLSQFISKQGSVYWSNAGKQTECHDVNVIFGNGFWPYYSGPWYLFHEEKKVHKSTWFDPYEHNSVENLDQILQEMANSHTWAILPWGREEAMAMIAFVTSDDQCWEEFVSAFSTPSTTLSESGLFLTKANSNTAPLLLTGYKNINSLENKFHGVLFGSIETAQTLWQVTGADSDPPIVLHFQQTGPDATIPAGNFENLETYKDTRYSERVLVRVLDSETFASYLPSWGTAVILSGDVDLESLRNLFQTPEFHKLPFYGTKFVSVASWAFFPTNGYSSSPMYETLLCRNPLLLSSFLHCPRNKQFKLFSCF
ncbi:MAG: hypothetical protein JWQ71_1712 [Pedosphaera sp.]|nr:hypothetical protein [Pedosphaera sp.]